MEAAALSKENALRQARHAGAVALIFQIDETDFMKWRASRWLATATLRTTLPSYVRAGRQDDVRHHDATNVTGYDGPR